MPEDIVAKVLHDFDEEDGLLVLQELQNLRSEGDNTSVIEFSEPSSH